MNRQLFLTELKELRQKVLQLREEWQEHMDECAYPTSDDSFRDADDYIDVQLAIAAEALEDAIPSVRM